MVKTLTDLQQYLDKMGYAVKIIQKKNGISAIFPSNKASFTQIEYDIVLNKDNSYYIMNYNDNCQKSIEVPIYAIELLICSHIYKACESVGFNPNLVKFYNMKNEQVNTFPAGIKLNKINAEKREKLLNIVSRLQQEPIDKLIEEAKINNVWDGFKIVRNIK